MRKIRKIKKIVPWIMKIGKKEKKKLRKKKHRGQWRHLQWLLAVPATQAACRFSGSSGYEQILWWIFSWILAASPEVLGTSTAWRLGWFFRRKIQFYWHMNC